MRAVACAQRPADGNGHVLYNSQQQSSISLDWLSHPAVASTFPITKYGLQQENFSPLTSPAICTIAHSVDLNDVRSIQGPTRMDLASLDASSNSLMAPPTVPGSASQSPWLVDQAKTSGQSKPATPTTLMRINNKAASRKKCRIMFDTTTIMIAS
jgi:hypothetical protein